MRPFLYLDIDGVLNGGTHPSLLPAETVMRFRSGDHVLVPLHRMFLDFYDEVRPSVVVVSSWATCAQVADISRFLGIPLYGRTDYCGGGLARGDSVMEHVKAHGVACHGILDDAGDRCYRDTSRVVAPDGRVGITADDLVRLRLLLSAPD